MKIPRRAGRLLRIFGDFSIWLVWTPKGPQRPNVVLVVFDTLLSETGGDARVIDHDFENPARITDSRLSM